MGEPKFIDKTLKEKEMKTKCRISKMFAGLGIGILAFLFLSCSQLLGPTTTSEKLASKALSGLSAGDVTFTLEMPAANPIIAPERGFYVLGAIDGDIPDGSLLTVTLYRTSDDHLMRQVYTDIKANKDGIYWQYPYIVLYGTDDPEMVKDSLMPDLIYDPVDVSTFKQQWRKCYYDDYNYTAVFNGGRYTFDVDDPNRLISYYYDIGDLSVGNRIGKFAKFADRDRLQLTRVDYLTSGTTTGENYIVFNDLANAVSDFDLSDGVTASVGESLALYGVRNGLSCNFTDQQQNSCL